MCVKRWEWSSRIEHHTFQFQQPAPLLLLPISTDQSLSLFILCYSSSPTMFISENRTCTAVLYFLPLKFYQSWSCLLLLVLCRLYQFCYLDHGTLNEAWTTPCHSHPSTSAQQHHHGMSFNNKNIQSMVTLSNNDDDDRLVFFKFTNFELNSYIFELAESKKQ